MTQPEPSTLTPKDRALVMWDALEESRLGVRQLGAAEKSEIRELTTLAMGEILRTWRPSATALVAFPEIEPRQIRGLDHVGIRWVRLSWTRWARSGTFVACAACAYILMPAPHTWTAWKIDVCRAHTDRCALRYLIAGKAAGDRVRLSGGGRQLTAGQGQLLGRK